MAYISGDTAAQLCREMLENNAKVDEVIFVLRAVGFPQSLCSILLSKTAGYPADEAKRAVINSLVWADHFNANIFLQEALEKWQETPE